MAATRCGFQNEYTFCHLTLQEFLAACHMSLLTDEEQLQVIQKYGGMSHMQVVFKFYCGLVNLVMIVSSLELCYNIPTLICLHELGFHLNHSRNVHVTMWQKPIPLIY